ncbi:hypothetical protein PVL29_016153 [Vitis rotundifolia]|uniref:Uncharacterized protein n=1 Tax=Vitis rotundifolia TaxID=103349 RepID=A0AA39DJX0_VITRO|nr:hypothetical protein PVL29_016153 [Vitis rotundifolia]
MASLRVPSISELVMIDYGQLQLKRPAGGFTSLQTSEIQISDISQWKQLPAGLRHLQIIKCDSAETLLEERILQTNNSFLKVLVINSCSFSRCFHRVGLPTTLKTLHIYWSTKLDFLLPELFKCHLPFLEQFWIRYSSCESLSLSFSLGALPRLTHLIIDGLKGLENLSIGVLEGDLTSLGFLKIHNCPDLVFTELPALNSACYQIWGLILKRCPELLFQRGGLPSNLCALEICLQMLVSLTHFTFKGGWEELESLPKDCPLPSTLTTLKLENVSNLKLHKAQHQQLTSLINLSIYYCLELHSFGEEGLQHLTSLEELQISGSGLQHLASLKQLYINDCPRLQSLTKVGLQSNASLKKLHISFCPELQSLTQNYASPTAPKLQYLTKERLPTSLSLLEIQKCPLLEHQCRFEKGEDWCHIAHIRRIVIDGVLF